MKILIFLLLILSAALHAEDVAAQAEIPGLVYIQDAKAFLSEDSKLMGADARRALRVAQAALAYHLKAEIQAKFKIAEASWGYQVNFSAVRTKKDGIWADASEGFGEVFLSKKMDRIKIEYGP